MELSCSTAELSDSILAFNSYIRVKKITTDVAVRGSVFEPLRVAIGLHNFFENAVR